MKNPNPFLLDPRDPIAALCLGSQLGAHVLVDWLLHREAARAHREGRASKIDTAQVHRDLHTFFTRALRSLRAQGGGS